LVARVGENELVQYLGRPPIVGCLECATTFGQERLRADELDVALGGFDQWMRVQRDRVAVPHSEFLGVDGAHVVVQRAVVAAVEPLAAKLFWQLDYLGRL
jgi:hypothetical protein